MDTLAQAWTARAPEADPMPVPSTIAWVDGALAVVETQEGSVRRFSAEGDYRDRTDVPTGSFPYGAGVRGDTLVVLARGTPALLWVVPGEGVAREVPAPVGSTVALATRDVLAVRLGGGPDALAPAVVRLDEQGRETARQALPGSGWRSVGFLRWWRDRVVALSGYRPVVDRLEPTEAGGLGAADTLALTGFYSPQLVRSAQFMRDDLLDQFGAEPTRALARHRRPAALLPQHLDQIVAQLVPGDIELPAFDREGAIFGRIGRQFVNREAERQSVIGRKIDLGPFEFEDRFGGIGIGRQLRLQHRAKRRGAPVGLGQQIVRRGEGADPPI